MNLLVPGEPVAAELLPDDILANQNQVPPQPASAEAHSDAAPEPAQPLTPAQPAAPAQGVPDQAAPAQDAAPPPKPAYPPPAETPTQEADCGLRFDFNSGCRVLLPNNDKPWKVRISDLDTSNILFETELKEGRVNSSKRYYVRF